MSQPVTLIVGSLALALLCFVCIQVHGPSIERDLGTRSRAALQANELGMAKVVMDGRDLTLTGAVASEAAKARAEVLAAAEWGVRAVHNELTVQATAAATAAPEEPEEPAVAGPSPELTLIGDGDGVTLKGAVPDEALRGALVKRAAALWKPGSVSDELEVQGARANARFSAAALAALEQLRALKHGESSVTPERVQISGLAAADSGGSAALEAALKGALSKVGDVAVEVDVKTALAVKDCQDEVNALLKGKKINFASSSATIDKSSAPLLARIARTLGRCPDSVIRVEGHTDATGDNNLNRPLSQDRADAVREHLLGLTIAPERVEAEGFGASKPIADNTTADGRAANRRIEFKLRGGE